MKNARIPVFFLILLLFLAAYGVIATADTAVVGYYPAWVIDELPAGEIDFGVITNVVYAFAWPENDGSISSYNPPAYPELVEAAHDAGRSVSISFGGGGQAAGFPIVTSDPSLRAEFVKNILAFCETYGYDGADFDWEFPESAEERDNYALLVTELRTAAETLGKPFLISMAISAASWPNFSNDYGGLSDIVDWFMVMTYNYAGPWSPVAGHNAPLYPRYDLGYSLSVSRSIDYLLDVRGIPPEKLLLGIPFYGREFEASVLYGTASGGGPLWYAAVTDTIDGGSWTKYWDDTSKAPYIVNADSTQIIVYDDPESVAVKCGYVLDTGLGGVGIWALGYDVGGGEQPLVTAIGETFGVTAVASDESTADRPAPFTLEQNHPNPFNMSTAVVFSMNAERHVRLAVYTITGQLAAVLYDGWAEAGRHGVTWDASGFPSGMYLCLLEAEGYREAAKMTLVK